MSLAPNKEQKKSAGHHKSEINEQNEPAITHNPYFSPLAHQITLLMGNLTSVLVPKTMEELQQFVRRLLLDTKALERMLHEELFETDPIRIGAEQEFNLIDNHFKPLGKNMEMLAKMNDESFTTELAKFNMEVNLEPLVFSGNCLSTMEKNINEKMKIARKWAAKFDADIVLAGILPTIRKFDLTSENRTPYERYKALMDGILAMKGAGSMELKINGTDELIMSHDSPMLEAANTGFQVHLQVAPDKFVERYNIAQAIAGPALAVAVNSPLLFGRRLWHETRIALFQQSVDTRSSGEHLRARSPRVMFGHNWLKKSILEIYREDIMRFRVLLSTNQIENPIKILDSGKVPALHSLLMHNSTVYRWNRPCYGVANGKAHLRIENRVLPAGPTVADEMANAALWLGLLNGFNDAYPKITKQLEFADAKANFMAACRMGIDTKFLWVDGKRITASELMKKELIPIAREGLRKAKVRKTDISRYMDILSYRVKTGQTGARWMIKSFNKLTKTYNKDTAIVALTASMVKQQREEIPISKWKLAGGEDVQIWNLSSTIVEEFMSTDLFTVQKDDIIELVAEIMDNSRLRYVPVEDQEGNLVGLITSRTLLRHYYTRSMTGEKGVVPVEQIMIKEPITIGPEKSLSEALRMMTENAVGCLPVVNKGKLIGVIVEQDFAKIAMMQQGRQG